MKWTKWSIFFALFLIRGNIQEKNFYLNNNNKKSRLLPEEQQPAVLFKLIICGSGCFPEPCKGSGKPVCQE